MVWLKCPRGGCHAQGPGRVQAVVLCEYWGSAWPSASSWSVKAGEWKDWGDTSEKCVLVDEKLVMSWQYALKARKPAVFWARRVVASRSREVFISLYSTFMTTHLEYCIWHWGPQHKKDVDLLEQVQQRATEMIRWIEHLLGSISLDKRAPERPYCGLWVLEGGLYERWWQTL